MMSCEEFSNHQAGYELRTRQAQQHIRAVPRVVNLAYILWELGLVQVLTFGGI